MASSKSQSNIEAIDDVAVNEFGAMLISATQTQFRVWATKAKQVSVEIVDRSGTVVSTHLLSRDENGIHSGVVDCGVGSLYRYKLNGNNPGRPDPNSRFQPFGVHGPSQVVDCTAYNWKDDSWRGVKKRDLVIYELHVGSFTEAGTYQSAIEKLDELIELGINAIELLPLAQTPGKWNWGYDGVNYYAPRNTFGSPNDLKEFVDACHLKQLAVIHDVVYNHVGPEGNYLNEFAPYRSGKFGTPWGDSLNFCGKDSKLVREFVIANIEFWIDEYHMDGLRLDAIHYMFDDSELFIVDEIRNRFRQLEQSHDREIHLIAESNIYDSELAGNVNQPDQNYDAIWSDCLMHSIYAHGRPDLRLTNRHYKGETDLPEALEHAYVFAAPQAIRVDDVLRAKHHPSGDKTYIESLVMALQTHDSVGNHPHGKRIHQLMSIDFQRAAAPLILLYPSIPMIFMGEEWASESPFPFFADFEDTGLRNAVDKGRRDEYPHHDWGDSPLPSDPKAFLSSKLSGLNLEMRDWYRQLLQLRKLGIKEGWLNVRNMSTSHVQSMKTFSLRFQNDNHDVTVCSRLECESQSSMEFTNFGGDSAVEVILDSTSNTPDKPVNSVELSPLHSCIWKQSRP